MIDGSGWWVIFPIIGLICMVLMMSRMFGFWRRGPRGMGGHSDEDSERGESALDLLRRRYAAGELTDEEFDAMRRKLGH